MPVKWVLAHPAMMDHADNISSTGQLTFSECASRIASFALAFRALTHQRLVITGSPGLGKATLAVQLLRELLAHPEPGERVPVLFSVTSWDPAAHPSVRGRYLWARRTEQEPTRRCGGDYDQGRDGSCDDGLSIGSHPGVHNSAFACTPRDVTPNGHAGNGRHRMPPIKYPATSSLTGHGRD